MKDNHIALLNVTIAVFDGDEAEFKIKRINVEQARYLTADGFVSYIGHDSTATVLSEILGQEVKPNRVEFKFSPNGRAICLKLNGRLPEGRILALNELNEFGYTLYLMERTR